MSIGLNLEELNKAIEASEADIGGASIDSKW